MPKFQVIVRGKDNELQAYDIKADAFKTEGELQNAAYWFYLLGNTENTVAVFPISQVVAIIDKDSQK